MEKDRLLMEVWRGGDWIEVGFEKTTLCLDSPKNNLDVSVHLQLHD